jgi:hypothetical protein
MLDCVLTFMVSQVMVSTTRCFIVECPVVVIISISLEYTEFGEDNKNQHKTQTLEHLARHC